ncbi:MAG: cryptochrome/photolyase family protein [Qingshengfaniella sp.]
MSLPAPGLFWLTRDFRFADNPALLAALRDGPLLAVFFVDRLTRAQGAASRWRLGRALAQFDAALRRRTGGQGVVVLHDEADIALPVLARRFGSRQIHQSDWPAPDMRALQDRVRRALDPAGAELVLHPGHLLTHPQALRTGSGGVYRVYTPFARALRTHGPERPAPDAPDRITAFAMPPDSQDPAGIDLAPDLHRGRAVLERFALPAGEAAAHDRLTAFLEQAAPYPADRDRPDLDATSGLSEHLALGEISPRQLWSIARFHAEIHPDQAPGIEKFLSEVIWREFAWHLLIDCPSLPQACWRQDWDDFPWHPAGPGLTHWQRAETGMALVDAGLREMWVTGRMHNRVRMVVASWLTKHLLTDWRAGLAHFTDCLTDWDPAANAMNWQWVAGCGPDATPFFRIFNPQRQAEQYDPEGRYRRRWLAGFMGAPGPEAQAWLDSVPTGWGSASTWQPGPPSALTEGRARALDALARFRSAQTKD